MRVLVIGGGPAGAIAAERLALAGVEVVMVEKNTTRPKTCAGALTWPVFEEFGLPSALAERTIRTIRFNAPSGRYADLRLDQPVFLLSREKLDACLRARAQEAGVRLVEAVCSSVSRASRVLPPEAVVVRNGSDIRLRADIMIGADGAHSVVARSLGLCSLPGLVACQERVVGAGRARELADRAEIFLGSDVSPDFYGWVFPKGDHIAVGTASGIARHGLPAMLARLKKLAGLSGAEVISREAGQLPLRSRRGIVSGRILLIGDAGGFVSPLSGEGIYYAMKSGRLAASCILHALARGRVPQDLAAYQAAWPPLFGRLTRGLWLAQRFYYSHDFRREAFVAMCRESAAARAGLLSFLGKKAYGSSRWSALKLILANLAAFLRAV